MSKNKGVWVSLNFDNPLNNDASKENSVCTKNINKVKKDDPKKLKKKENKRKKHFFDL